ncbi:hypothetical protein ERX46_06890 [Brumimicrobium glaciale]|uniref:DUF3575 domain-containing protein n=1 Tax=Brumimicrobium glaciale TaxID=200475 RepID=A0A4V1WG13_9FLAO|nr:hypothetical protein [Brumimicrobium glaciale]RYM35096.1 hypothetical protein ERX46_06890 [Brumimicrobium glaciale]
MKTILTFIFALSFTFIHSQPRTITVDSEQLEKSDYLESNAIKLHLLEFTSSDFSLYYEKALFSKISAEVGIGLTFADDIGHISSPTTNGPINPDNKLGYSFTAAIRFYPSEILNQFYIAPEYKFRKYNWNREFSNYFGFTDVDGVRADESRVHSIPRITFGYVVYLFEYVFVDFHFGMGINSRTETLYNPFTSQIEVNKLSPRPKVNGGFKIGFIF